MHSNSKNFIHYAAKTYIYSYIMHSTSSLPLTSATVTAACHSSIQLNACYNNNGKSYATHPLGLLRPVACHFAAANECSATRRVGTQFRDITTQYASTRYANVRGGLWFHNYRRWFGWLCCCESTKWDQQCDGTAAGGGRSGDVLKVSGKFRDSIAWEGE